MTAERVTSRQPRSRRMRLVWTNARRSSNASCVTVSGTFRTVRRRSLSGCQPGPRTHETPGGQPARNPEGEIVAYLRKGFLLRMRGEITQVNLIAASGTIVRDASGL